MPLFILQKNSLLESFKWRSSLVSFSICLQITNYSDREAGQAELKLQCEGLLPTTHQPIGMCLRAKVS